MNFNLNINDDFYEDSFVSEIENVAEYNNLDDIEDETVGIISDIIADGYDASLEYEIIHSMAAKDFADLEKCLIALTDKFPESEVDEAEEITEENGKNIFCVEFVTVHPLDKDELMTEINTIVELCNAHNVIYDGWGTQVDDDADE